MAKLNCVTVLAPAKLNLALDVVGLLPNGYHNLDMTMQAITLYERVVLRRSQNLSLTLPGSPVAANDSNTAIKAALAFFHYTGLLAGVEITIYKNVPVRAGMAGGSADAAGVLVGLNVLYGAKLSMSELCALGAKIGADVPFALMGGTCRAEDLAGVCAAAGNALEECSGARDNEAIKTALKENGAVTALMTGSGAAVFGIFESEEAARSAAEAVRAQWPQVYVARPDRGGARVISPKWML